MGRSLRWTLFLSLATVILASATVARRPSKAQEGIPLLETRLYGQSAWLSGSAASLRVITFNHQTGNPVPEAQVEIALHPGEEAQAPGGTGQRASDKRPLRLFQGRTNRLGTVDASFRVPNWAPGSYRLAVAVAALGERDRIEKPITLRTGEQVLLTTDKPLYQPGQTIHIRALALRQPNQAPLASAQATLEVEDAKGNKVFKRQGATSAYGIFSADFALADEVNQGRYTIRALVGQAQQEKTVTVERYVLPKFRVSFTPQRKFYLPGQVLQAKVEGQYFFGKPVARAQVEVTLSKFDAGFQEFARIQGHLNEEGVFTFQQELPAFFVGQPLEQGNAFVKYEVAVTDTADHTEMISGMVPVASQPIKITAVPESGRLVPHVENIIYFLATYPDGSPAKVRLTLTAANTRLGDTLSTDDSGIAEWRLTPRQPELALRVSAVDETGNRADTDVRLAGDYRPEGLLLRTDRALYTVGDTLHLSVLAPGGSGTIYFDLVRAGQTLLTRSAPMKGGRADLSLSLSPDAAGTLQVHAYRLQPDGQILRDTRVVFVDPGRALNIQVQPDREVYTPGSTAKLTLLASVASGTAEGRLAGPPIRPFPAALGVSIVDESVFALQEMQPGMEKVYFLLEKEILEPRFEIHAIEPTEIVKPALQRDPTRQRAATILFASLPQRDAFTLKVDTYQEKMAKLAEKWQKEIEADALRIATAVKAYRARSGEEPEWEHILSLLVRQQGLRLAETRDPFGRPYRVRRQGDYVAVLSNGPDGKENTGDDLMVMVGPDLKVVRFGMPGRMWRRGEMVFADGAVALAMPEAALGAAPPAAVKMQAAGAGVEATLAGADMGGGRPEVRVRQYFPETLYWNPAVITDEQGKATLEVPMADSITTWRLTAMASSAGGLLGSVAAPLRVFQDFFVDIDFPVSLTQNDEVAVPIAVYNYLDRSQKVRLVVEREPWFDLLEDAEKVLEISSSDVRGTTFRLRVKEIGFHKLTVRAYGTAMSDAVRREVEVVPDGRRVEATLNDRLEGTVRKVVEIPKEAIPGAANILVKVYPGFLSQAVEGMDQILQMPFGCFEQTSSATYPNVLVLDYMRTANKITPEIQMKAEQYINLGYQRLLTFEVPGGGFSWFGDPPANKVLTAYGLMEFQDMSAVYEVDPSLITRTREWLLGQQEKDGTWKPDSAYLHEESWGRIQHSELLPTAYITWALLSEAAPRGKTKGPLSDRRLAQAVEYLAKNWDRSKDPYTLGILANALVAAGRPEGDAVLRRLLEMAIEEEGGLYWRSDASTITFSRGEGANVEATAIIGYALVRSGRYPAQASKVITYLVRSRDPRGTWNTTQATVLALKTLLASQKGSAEGVDARVSVRINGQEAGAFRITPANADVMQTLDLKRFVRPGANEVEIAFQGKGNSLYQISSYHYLPWKIARLEPQPPKIVEITVSYDRTELEKNDLLTSRVRVAYRGPGEAARMVMVDLGIPPGFEVLSEDLNKLLAAKVIQRFQMTPRQVILYVERLEKAKPLDFTYRMKARFPMRAKTAASTVYQYYNPEIKDTAAPVEVVVR